MTANDLMIGDWVVSDIHGQGKVTKIQMGDNGNFIEIALDKSFKRVLYGDSYFEPIPLTREILKKNDFEGDRIMEYRFEEGGETYNLYLKEMYNRDGVQDSWGTNVGGVLPSVVMYVHELQHILRLAGLKEKADNFKIK